MNKSALTKALAEKLNLDMRRTRRITDVVLDAVSEALIGGRRIELRGFGTFVVRRYEPYTGRNPKTGETIKIPSRKLPFFKPGKHLRERVDRRVKANILVIDDEKSVRDTFHNMLEKLGYSVVTTSSGEEGLRILKEGSIDLVVTDLAMPGLSGWDVALKAKEIDPSVRVVMTTLWEDDLWMEKVRRSGVDMVMSKSSEYEDIGQVIASALEIERAGGSLRG